MSNELNQQLQKQMIPSKYQNSLLIFDVYIYKNRYLDTQWLPSIHRYIDTMYRLSV